MESLLKRARDFMLSRDKAEQKPEEDEKVVEKSSQDNEQPEVHPPPAFVTTEIVPMESSPSERRSTRPRREKGKSVEKPIEPVEPIEPVLPIEEKKKVLRSKKHVTFLEPAKEDEVPSSVVVDQIEKTTVVAAAPTLLPAVVAVQKSPCEASVGKTVATEKDQTESLEITTTDPEAITHF